jgi:hypothetical protein
MNRDIARQIVVALCVPASIVLNFLPFAQRTARNVSGGARSIPLEAAGYAFSIWGVLFAWQLVYAVWQALPRQREDPLLRRVGWLTALNSVGNGAWVVLVSQGLYAASWLVILATLTSLVILEVLAGPDSQAHGRRQRWLVRVPYRLNLAWISVASILATASFLRNDLGWDGAPVGPVFWGVVMVVVSAALGVAMLALRRAVPFALVVGWALVAIAVGSARTPAIAHAATAMTTALAVALVASIVRHRSPTPLAAT